MLHPTVQVMDHHKLELFDLTGKKILMVSDIVFSPYILDLGSLEKGIYLVKLRGTKVYLDRLIVR